MNIHIQKYILTVFEITMQYIIKIPSVFVNDLYKYFASIFFLKMSTNEMPFDGSLKENLTATFK